MKMQEKTMADRQQLYPNRLIFHCDETTKKEVDEFARKERITRAEAMRRLLRKGLKA